MFNLFLSIVSHRDLPDQRSFQAFYDGKCKHLEDKLRAAYQKSTGADCTPVGSASLKHGIVTDPLTGKFMATFDLGKNGSVCKIFVDKQDADFWWDSMQSLFQKGRLVPNLAAVRQAQATRKATAAVIEQIMKENISMKGEENVNYSRDTKEGSDVFQTFFRETPASQLRPSKVRIYKSSLEQLEALAKTQDIQGVLAGMMHMQLGWRAKVCIVTGGCFTDKDADEFIESSGMTKLGIFSSSTTVDPSDAAVASLQLVKKVSKCAVPLLLLFIQEKFKVTPRGFELNPTTNELETVSVETIAKRASGEEFQVLGVDGPQTKADPRSKAT